MKARPGPRSRSARTCDLRAGPRRVPCGPGDLAEGASGDDGTEPTTGRRKPRSSGSSRPPERQRAASPWGRRRARRKEHAEPPARWGDAIPSGARPVRTKSSTGLSAEAASILSFRLSFALDAIGCSARPMMLLLVPAVRYHRQPTREAGRARLTWSRRVLASTGLWAPESGCPNRGTRIRSGQVKRVSR